MKQRLYLCSGRAKHDDMVTLDMNEKFEPDIVASLPSFKLGQIRPEPWQQIYLIHGIEHFSAEEGQELLNDMYSVLASGGTLILEQPNLEAAAAALLNLASFTGEWERDSLWAIYGAPLEGKYPGMGHKFGYTPSMLSQALVRCGFLPENIKVLPSVTHVPVRDFRIEATKA